MPSPLRGRALVLSIGLLTALSIIGGPGNAAPGTKKALRKTQSPPRSRTSPDVTATIPAGKANNLPTPAPTVEDDESVPPPFNLPTASRARMRACGETWQAMKMSGEAKDQTWRAYATKCLASKDSPEKISHP